MSKGETFRTSRKNSRHRDACPVCHPSLEMRKVKHKFMGLPLNQRKLIIYSNNDLKNLEIA